MSERNEMLVRFEDVLGGAANTAAQDDADKLAVAMAVSARRLPTAAELEAFAAHLREVADRLGSMAKR